MHEAAHAFLSHKLGGKSGLKRAISPIVTAMKRIPDFVDSEFDTSNIDEFLAEFISNAGFRKRLTGSDPHSPQKRQISDQFYERVIGGYKSDFNLWASGIPTKARAKQDNMVKDLDALVLDLLSAATKRA